MLPHEIGFGNVLILYFTQIDISSLLMEEHTNEMALH